MNNNIYLVTNLSKARQEVRERIEKILKIDDFELSIEYIKAIHKYLFRDILVSSGEFRKYNLNKKETILNDYSVIYTDYKNIERNLTYDIYEEKKINYKTLNNDIILKRLAKLSIRIWSTHPFIEGNTRTTSVFMQKYLKHLGYQIEDNYFKKHSSYFRNALVKGTYYNQEYGIIPDIQPLIKFYEKLLYDKNIKLKQSDLIVKELFEVYKELPLMKTRNINQ